MGEDGQEIQEVPRLQMDVEEPDTAALRKLLSLRRNGEFTGARQMDERLAEMIADKRRALGLHS